MKESKYFCLNNMSHLCACKWSWFTSNGSETEAVHTSAERENNDIKCFSFLIFLGCSLPYHQKCPSVSSLWQQTSEFRQCWTVWLSVWCLLRWLYCSFISQLSTWIYIFICTNQFSWTSRANCLNSILAEEKIKAAVLALRIGSSQSLLCSLMMDNVYDLGLLLDPFLFVFFEVCK